jgi:P-type Mg2+ transporter
VIVKRLVAIEDLGNIDVFFTDKTGTLTEGRISFAEALGTSGKESDDTLRYGLLCNDAIVQDGRLVGRNALDHATWAARRARSVENGGFKRLAARPFDYERRVASALVVDPAGEQKVIAKGAPEIILDRCWRVPDAARSVLDEQFAAGSSVVAIATRPADGQTHLSADDERDLELVGFLTFLDQPKPDAASALARLDRLGVAVKVITGDNQRVAA